MAREIKTAEEIRDEVSRLIHEGEDVESDKAEIRVSLPMRLAAGNADGGSNWTMSVFGNSAGHTGWCVHCMHDVQGRWDLARLPARYCGFRTMETGMGIAYELKDEAGRQVATSTFNGRKIKVFVRYDIDQDDHELGLYVESNKGVMEEIRTMPNRMKTAPEAIEAGLENGQNWIRANP